ncbi:FAD-dependent oxidoreductase [Citricoccus sp. NPDC055426]|uniref:GcvT family protein n=1 Tax=Citricoccus sp. NPDC055426 TaxID=3155536 RepID=UPI003420A67B
MGSTTRSPRVVIIGAGIVGANLADELTERGCTDVTVLDQGPIPVTGGSTSHAPGLVFQTNPSRTMATLAAYTARKLSGLRWRGESAYNAVGGLELATTEERLAELHRRCNLATAWGLEASVLDPEQAAALHPLLHAERILGALHLPGDGLASSVLAVEALRARAESRGARFLERVTVTGLEHDAGRVTGVRAGREVFGADVVVSAAGFWGPQIGELAGTRVPLVPLAHQYVTTSEVPALRGWTDGEGAAAGTGNTARLPILRHQGEDLYFRQIGSTLGIGSYAHRPMPARIQELPEYDAAAGAMPSKLPFTPADFEGPWAASLALLPDLSGAHVREGFNGIFSFTPDGGSLVGESPELRGFFLAEAVWVTHSAGVGRAVAELIVDGQSHTDLRELDVARFEEVQLAGDYVLETSQQAFVEVYDIKHPLEPRLSPRDLRLSPFHARQVGLGASFLESGGWERPHWFEANRALLERLPPEWVPPRREGWTARYDSPVSAAEAHATRTNVALFDLTSLRRLEVSGPGAVGLLERLTTGRVDREVGSVGYALMLTESGGIRSDVTVARLGQDVFQVGANGGIDAAYLQQAAADWNAGARGDGRGDGGGEVQVEDITDRTCCIGVWGPRARDLVQPLTQLDLSDDGLPYFRAAVASVAGIGVRMLRVSYVGELGWEIYADNDDGLALWDALWEAGRDLGVVAAGRAAFNSLRIEKGYRAWGTDVDTEHDPWAAGLGFAVRKDRSGYVGEEAVARMRAGTSAVASSGEPTGSRAGRRRALRCLTVDDAVSVVMGSDPVFVGDDPVGYTTSAAYGYTVHRPIAYAWLPESAGVGDAVQIRSFDRMVPATVTAEPLVDPEGKRLRG